MKLVAVPVLWLLLLLGCTLGRRSPRLDCPAKLIAMDKAVEKSLLLTNPDLKPFNGSQDFIENYCNLFPDWVKTISAYRTCLKSFQKTVFGIITSNMKKNYKRVCLSEKEVAGVVGHSKCFTQENKKFLHMQIQKLTGIVEYVADRPNPDDMIPGLCCGFQLLARHVEQQVDRICNSTSGSLRTGHFVRYVIEDNISDALEIMCGNYGSLEECQTRSPQRMQDLRTVVESSTTVYNHTAFVSLLRFIERMDSTVNVQ